MIFTILLIPLLFAISGAVDEYESKIIGGTQVSIEDFPYQASLLFQTIPFCGGSIIGQEWILTAAHCIIKIPNFEAKYLKIRVGSDDNSYGGQLLEPKKIIIHDQYDNHRKINDVALILVKELITAGRPVKLASTEMSAGKILWVTGWGMTSADGPETNKLRGAPVKVVDRDICAAGYRAEGIMITNAMICASSPGADSCQGDSGGPIASKGVQYGVVSFGIKCADPRFPGVYTNLAAPVIRKFITNMTGI